MAVVPFTSENAREMARRANAKRRENKARMKAELEESRIQSIAPLPAEYYIDRRLIRVRKQLDRVDEMMMSEEDTRDWKNKSADCSKL